MASALWPSAAVAAHSIGPMGPIEMSPPSPINPSIFFTPVTFPRKTCTVRAHCVTEPQPLRKSARARR